MGKFICPKCKKEFGIGDVVGECPICHIKEYEKTYYEKEKILFVCCGNCGKGLMLGNCHCPYCGEACNSGDYII